MHAYVHFKGLRLDFLQPKKVTSKVNKPKPANAFASVLCSPISELHARHNQRQMTPHLSRLPDLQLKACITPSL